MSRVLFSTTNDTDMPDYGEADWDDYNKLTQGEGIFKTWGQAFNCTNVVNTLTINTGAVAVDGKLKSFPIPTTITIPTPTANTNHRIVVRKDLSAVGDAKVSIILKSGNNGDPSIPALTQIRGGVFELGLWQVQALASGGVILTDERTYAANHLRVTAAQLDNGSVNYNTLATGAVRTNHISSGIPKGLYRIGAGVGNNWSASGLSNVVSQQALGLMNIVPGIVRIRFNQGVSELLEVTVQLPSPSQFSSAPFILLTPKVVSGITATNYLILAPILRVGTVTEASFTIRGSLNPTPAGGYADFDVMFMAIGPA